MGVVFPRPLTKTSARAWLSVAVTAALLAWLFSRIDASRAWALVRGASPGWLLLAAALGPVQIALSAERWKRAANALQLPLPRREAVAEFALGTFLNQLLPGGVAGDAVRVWRQRRDDRELGPVLRAAVADRAFGVGALCGVVLLSLLAWPWLHPGVARPTGAVVVAAGVALLLLLAALAPARTPLWGRIAPDLRRAVLHPSVVWGQLGISLLLTATFMLGFAACAQALGQELGMATLTVVPWLLLAMSVPLSVGGWGPREATAVALLPALGWSAESAMALSALYGLTALAGAVPGALVPLLPPASEDA
ncbi:MAG: flippase-like domain-containing protein [Myxococcales bacterium]|nr:flippase-like domain-containing protein [Myxococcales bacterium]